MLGGYAGLAIYGIPLVASLLTGGPSLEVLIISILGIAAILTAWSYLESSTSGFSTSVEISAPPAIVWETMRDVVRWPEWTSAITNVDLLEPGPLALGSRVRIRQPRLPPAGWTVTELMEGRGFSWISRAPGIEVTARYTVASSGAGTTATLSLTFDGPMGPLLGWLTRGINTRYLALEAEGLKRQSESR